MRYLEANLGVLLWYLFAELHIETVYTISTTTHVHWFAVRSICGCGLRLFGKMSMQRKHRSKGRVLGTQGLWAELQVLAQSSYLGQIRLCHLSRRTAELSWRTRWGEETRRTLFCRPWGAHVSCRKHLKLILLMSERETECLWGSQAGESIGTSSLELHYRETAHQGNDVFMRVSALSEMDHSAHLYQNKHFRAAADSDFSSLANTCFALALPIIFFRENSVSTDKIILFFFFFTERLELFPSTVSSASKMTCLPPQVCLHEGCC